MGGTDGNIDSLKLSWRIKWEFIWKQNRIEAYIYGSKARNIIGKTAFLKNKIDWILCNSLILQA